MKTSTVRAAVPVLRHRRRIKWALLLACGHQRTARAKRGARIVAAVCPLCKVASYGDFSNNE